MRAFPPVVFVTGTDTDVGKTIVTAALAAALTAGGKTVAVYKPAQAGTYRGGPCDGRACDGGTCDGRTENGGPCDGWGDTDVVRRLAGIADVHEGIRLPDPMAPVAAAARAGVALPPAGDHAAAIGRLAQARDHVLVEGAGGVLVQLAADGGTLADIAAATAPGACAVVVCRSGLGTLNHTELTLEALARRGVRVTGTVIGSWPRHPGEVDLSNWHYFRAGAGPGAVPLIGSVPERAAALAPAEFRAAAPRWFSPAARPG